MFEDMEYMQPETIEALESCLASMTPKSRILAGGTDLIVKMREKNLETDKIISLCMLKELQEIQIENGWLKIGSMVTHTMAEESPLVQKYFPALRDACSHVGSRQIRNKGTLGGNLCNASPAGDMLPCMYLYDAEVEIMDAKGRMRRCSITDFLDEKGRSTLLAGELLLAMYLPVRETQKSCFIKLGSRREVTIAQISLCAAWENENLKICMGAVDLHPVVIAGFCTAFELMHNLEIRKNLAEELEGIIRNIRLKRGRPPRLKITEAEQLYKERAVKGVVWDLAERMKFFDGL